ncbi:protein-methionine-sulfoxide reductase heme-binding subunit MsrQ [Ferrimonas senticii]|uniref:protein-methionine-sulfoxide reductase heme-binding subunit MsrQ n=1 Tax=Ferrimonas senticii TaxID=394566 RepID=UPI0003FC4138|nr:protein-methionine-sulfoxide reductase heme-binding subunit MsrQ [Ferrimonas senticii]
MVLARKILLVKTALHLACALPLLWLYLQLQSGALGGDPVQYLIHFLGMGTLHTLATSLLVSPLAKRFKAGWLIRTRRLLGLWCFTYALLHVGAFAAFDLLFDWSLLLRETIKRPYIVVGAIGLLILLVLALTSPLVMQRKLGRRWQPIHRSVYLLALLGPLHFWWSVKSGNLEPLLYLLGFIGLLLLRQSYWQRFIPKRQPTQHVVK